MSEKEVIDRKKLGKKNKSLGSRIERLYANFFRDLDPKFDKCVTARLGSRLMDNCKIDIINIPFNIQIKAGVHKNLSPGKELINMKTMIEKSFLPDESVHSKPCLLIHHKIAESGKKRTLEDSMVFMSLIQFDVWRNQVKDLEYTQMKAYKFDLQSEFKTMVAMPFDYFVEKIVKPLYL